MPLHARLAAIVCGLGVTALFFLTASLVASVEPHRPGARTFVMWGTAIGFGLSFGYWLLAALPVRAHRFCMPLRAIGVVATLPVAIGCINLLFVTSSQAMRTAAVGGLIMTAWLCWQAIRETAATESRE
jgi:hypothetical protein